MTTPFILWPNCPNEHGDEAKAVLSAARKLSDPTNQNKTAAVEVFTTYTGANKKVATDLAQDIIDGVKAAQQHARNKQ